MLTTNRAKLLLKIVEDLIDPQQPYPVTRELNKWTGLNDKEKEWSKSTHTKLVKEAMRHVDQNDDKSEAGSSIAKYVANSYGKMNDHLRHGTVISDEEKKNIQPLKGLTKHPTEHTFTTYRGAKQKLFDHAPGTVFQDKGFTSTSLRPSIADRFATRKGQTGDKYVYRIHVTPGTKGHYLSGHVGAGSDMEREFLLHPGTRFKVGHSYQHPDGNTYTDLHIHSQEE